MKLNIRYAFLFIIILLIPQFTLSQYSKEFPNSDVTVYAGAGFPVGDYSGDASDQLGHASTGIVFGGDYANHLIEFFDLGLRANLGFNGFDEDKLAKELGPGVKVSASHYTNTSIMAGIGFNIPMTQNIKIYGRGYLGLMRSTSPEVTMSGTLHGTLTSASSYAFCYLFNAGISVFPIDISVGYYGATPTYKYNDASGNEIKIDQTIGVIQLTLGYTIKLQ